MEKYPTINSYKRKLNNRNQLLIPKITINPRYNITTYNNKIYSKRNNNNEIKNKITKTEIYSKSPIKTIDSPNRFLFKTIFPKNNYHTILNKNYSLLKNKKSKIIKRTTNDSQKISLKLLNQFFKPKIKDKNESNTIQKMPVKLKKKIYNSSEIKKETSPYNYLYYYFPSLFNVPNNRITGPQNLNSSNFLFSSIPKLSFYEEVENLKTSFHKSNKINNNNVCFPTDNNIENEKTNNPFFVEKFCNIDILKNLRFGFKSWVEKEKYKNLVKSFYTVRNLKCIFPKSMSNKNYKKLNH